MSEQECVVTSLGSEDGVSEQEGHWFVVHWVTTSFPPTSLPKGSDPEGDLVTLGINRRLHFEKGFTHLVEVEMYFIPCVNVESEIMYTVLAHITPGATRLRLPSRRVFRRTKFA